jgi:hypothetical protein
MKHRLSATRRPVTAAAAAALTATALAAGTVAAMPASAKTAQTEQAERFTGYLALRASSGQPAWSTITADGAFDARGTIKFGANGPHGIHHDILVFPDGTINLAEKGKTDTFTFNPKTCIGTDHETGTYQLTGTGQYASATGNGSWHHDATIVAPLKAACTPNSPGTVAFVRFAASGPITLGG